MKARKRRRKRVKDRTHLLQCGWQEFPTARPPQERHVYCSPSCAILLLLLRLQLPCSAAVLLLLLRCCLKADKDR